MNNGRGQAGDLGKQHHVCVMFSFLASPDLLKQIFGDHEDGSGMPSYVHDLQKLRQNDWIAGAIEPYFNDITIRGPDMSLYPDLWPLTVDDRKLGDAPPKQPCKLTLSFPGLVSWQTEGKTFKAQIGAPLADPNEFAELEMPADCRMFWTCHSNGALCFHVSLDIVYSHSFEHFIALSLLQKVRFDSEGTTGSAREVEVKKFSNCESLAANGQQSLRAFLGQVFGKHLENLLDRAFASGNKAQKRGRKALATLTQSKNYSDYWRFPEPSETLPAVADMFKCRLLFLFEDPTMFDVVCRTKEIGGTLPFPHDLGKCNYQGFEPAQGKKYQAQILNKAIGAECLCGYFMSGFFHNVIDFMRQDESEVQDGLDPLYPAPDDQFLLYANPHAAYELVRSSRSLESARDYIGMCPYLFLVHAMTMMDEYLVHQYETQVGKLRGEMQESGLTVEGHESAKLDDILKKFKSFRIKVFEEIETKRYFNNLRYDTERTFFEEIEKARRLREREAYWKGILGEIEHAVTEMRGDERGKFEDRLQLFLLAIGSLTIVQTVLMVIGAFRPESKPGQGSEPVSHVGHFQTLIDPLQTWLEDINVIVGAVGLILCVGIVMKVLPYLVNRYRSPKIRVFRHPRRSWHRTADRPRGDSQVDLNEAGQ